MERLFYLKPEALIAFLFYQSMLQEQLIEAQQKIIELQQRIDEMTPKTPTDEDVFWHLTSSGVPSHEAATSNDLELVRKFKDWNITFAEKHIKPFVNPKVYNETLNQMTRGLAIHIAELQNKRDRETTPKSGNRILPLEDHTRPKGSKAKQAIAAVP